MLEYKCRMSENGRILIPASIRHYLHFEAGEEILMRIQNNELRLISLKSAITNAQDLVESYIPAKRSLVEALKNARKEEVKNEKKRS